MKNEKIQALVTKAKYVANHIGKILIILIAISVGFVIGGMYTRANETVEEKAPLDMKLVHKLKETSIAINERSELMIINRQTGTYEIYEDSIGKVVFGLYASQMISNVSK
jgi:hypothetical protein